MKKVSIGLIIASIIMIVVGSCFSFYNFNKKNGIKESENAEEIGFIKLKIGDVTTVNGGGELLGINDYKLYIPQELVEIGYDISEKNNILTIVSKDNKYKFVLVQLTDDYKMPTEKEIDAFYETEEYIKLEEAHYGDTYLENFDKIYTDYYKGLGYTKKNSPDYTMTIKEMDDLIKDFVLAGESKSSSSTGLFPGYAKYKYYDWGETVLYTIPKSYESEMFGLDESKFSACIYTFGYYNIHEIYYDISLWTL